MFNDAKNPDRTLRVNPNVLLESPHDFTRILNRLLLPSKLPENLRTISDFFQQNVAALQVRHLVNAWWYLNLGKNHFAGGVSPDDVGVLDGIIAVLAMRTYRLLQQQPADFEFVCCAKLLFSFANLDLNLNVRLPETEIRYRELLYDLFTRVWNVVQSPEIDCGWQSIYELVQALVTFRVPLERFIPDTEGKTYADLLKQLELLFVTHVLEFDIGAKIYLLFALCGLFELNGGHSDDFAKELVANIMFAFADGEMQLQFLDQELREMLQMSAASYDELYALFVDANTASQYSAETEQEEEGEQRPVKTEPRPLSVVAQDCFSGKSKELVSFVAPPEEIDASILSSFLIQNEDERSLLHYKVWLEKIESIAFILKHLRELNCGDKEGITPLMLYCGKKKKLNPKIFAVFIEALPREEVVAELNRRDNKNRTALCHLLDNWRAEKVIPEQFLRVMVRFLKFDLFNLDFSGPNELDNLCKVEWFLCRAGRVPLSFRLKLLSQKLSSLGLIHNLVDPRQISSEAAYGHIEQLEKTLLDYIVDFFNPLKHGKQTTLRNLFGQFKIVIDRAMEIARIAVSGQGRDLEVVTTRDRLFAADFILQQLVPLRYQGKCLLLEAIQYPAFHAFINRLIVQVADIQQVLQSDAEHDLFRKYVRDQGVQIKEINLEEFSPHFHADLMALQRRFVCCMSTVFLCLCDEVFKSHSRNHFVALQNFYSDLMDGSCELCHQFDPVTLEKVQAHFTGCLADSSITVREDNLCLLDAFIFLDIFSGVKWLLECGINPNKLRLQANYRSKSSTREIGRVRTRRGVAGVRNAAIIKHRALTPLDVAIRYACDPRIFLLLIQFGAEFVSASLPSHLIAISKTIKLVLGKGGADAVISRLRRMEQIVKIGLKLPDVDRLRALRTAGDLQVLRLSGNGEEVIDRQIVAQGFFKIVVRTVFQEQRFEDALLLPLNLPMPYEKASLPLYYILLKQNAADLITWISESGRINPAPIWPSLMKQSYENQCLLAQRHAVSRREHRIGGIRTLGKTEIPTLLEFAYCYRQKRQIILRLILSAEQLPVSRHPQVFFYGAVVRNELDLAQQLLHELSCCVTRTLLWGDLIEGELQRTTDGRELLDCCQQHDRKIDAEVLAKFKDYIAAEKEALAARREKSAISAKRRAASRHKKRRPRSANPVNVRNPSAMWKPVESVDDSMAKLDHYLLEMAGDSLARDGEVAMPEAAPNFVATETTVQAKDKQRYSTERDKAKNIKFLRSKGITEDEFLAVLHELDDFRDVTMDMLGYHPELFKNVVAQVLELQKSAVLPPPKRAKAAVSSGSSKRARRRRRRRQRHKRAAPKVNLVQQTMPARKSVDLTSRDSWGNSALHSCVFANDFQLAEEILSQNPLLMDEVNMFGVSAIDYALAAIPTDTTIVFIRHLINRAKAGEQVLNIAAIQFNNTLLHYLITFNMDRQLIAEVIDLTEQNYVVDSHGRGVLDCAIFFENVDVVQKLLERPSDFFVAEHPELHGNSLHLLLARPRPNAPNREIVHLVLEAYPDLVASRNSLLQTLLHLAIKYRRMGVCEQILAMSPDKLKDWVNLTDHCVDTPLHYALIYHHPSQFIRALLRAGAAGVVCDSYGLVTSHLAYDPDTKRIFNDYIIEKQMHIFLDKISNRKFLPTFVQRVCADEDWDALEKLFMQLNFHEDMYYRMFINNKFDLSEPVMTAITWLHFVVIKEVDPVAVAIFIKYGAKLQGDDAGQTPLFYAAGGGNGEALELLQAISGQDVSHDVAQDMS